MKCPRGELECGEDAFHAGKAACVEALRAQLGEALRWDDAEKDQWTAEIKAAFPTRSGAHEAYADAMHMVGNRRSKGALVALVTWLIVRLDAKHADLVRVADKYRDANARAERLRAELMTAAKCLRLAGYSADAARTERAAQPADAPETSAKTSEAERSDFAQRGSGASPVGPDVTRADLAPAEAPKSRDYECVHCGARFPKQPRCPRCGK